MGKALRLLRAAKRFAADKNYRTHILALCGRYGNCSDEEYLKRIYQVHMGVPLNLENPETFNEKLQWLKLYDRRPEYTVMADKYLVRDYIAKKLGGEYLIPLLGVWDDPAEIDFDKLPRQFVLKCNHNSGLGMCICRDKSTLDVKKVRAGLRKGLKEDYYLYGREWPYKDIPRKIVCEQYMSDSSGTQELTDYKFFCFNGKADSVMVCLDRFSGDTKFYFFDRNWTLLPLNIRGKNAPKGFTVPKPVCMDEMFEIAGKLSAGIPFVRVDLYECNGKIYFGELTFFPQSGFDANLLREADVYYGSLIHLERNC